MALEVGGASEQTERERAAEWAAVGVSAAPRRVERAGAGRHRDEPATTADIDDADPVPLGHRFDVVWRGYHRRQVNEYINLQLRWLTKDRDAAMEMVRTLTELLEESRSQTRLLRERFDRVCREPLSPDAISERLRCQVAIARAEASHIITTARARAEHIRVEAAEDAARQAATAERRRREVEEDFQIAMAERRDAIIRSLREYEAACRAEAGQLVRDASRAAAQQLSSVLSQVESLRTLQRHLARRLCLADGLVRRASALVEPAAGEATSG